MSAAVNAARTMGSPEMAASLDALYQIGWELYQRDDFTRAADVFRFLALLQPTRHEAWWALGACHEQLDDDAVAAVLYEIAFRAGEGPAELGLLCARARARAGDRSGAADLLASMRGATRDDAVLARIGALETEIGGGVS